MESETLRIASADKTFRARHPAAGCLRKRLQKHPPLIAECDIARCQRNHPAWAEHLCTDVAAYFKRCLKELTREGWTPPRPGL